MTTEDSDDSRLSVNTSLLHLEVNLSSIFAIVGAGSEDHPIVSALRRAVVGLTILRFRTGGANITAGSSNEFI